MEWVALNYNFINNYKGNFKELKDEIGKYKLFNFINNYYKGNIKEKLDGLGKYKF